MKPFFVIFFLCFRNFISSFKNFKNFFLEKFNLQKFKEFLPKFSKFSFLFLSLFFILFLFDCSAKIEVPEYTAEFKVNGGSPISSITLKEGDKIDKDKLPTSTKEGWIFQGFYQDEDFKEKFNWDSPILKDTKVYLKWAIKTYTVTFNTDGGSEFASATINYGAKISRPIINPTKTGFTFINWFKENTFNNVFDFDVEYPITADTTIYAKFNLPPNLKSGAEWKHFMRTYNNLGGNTSDNELYLNSIFSDAEGDSLTYTIEEAFRNNGDTDVKNLFFIANLSKGHALRSKARGNVNEEKGYYRIKLKAVDSWGAETYFYLSAQIINSHDTSSSIDLSSVNYNVTLIPYNYRTNYIRTGSGNDKTHITYVGGIIDLGSGDNSYRFTQVSSKFYIYNFNSGDKVYFRSTYLFNKDERNDFKGFTFSSYANKSDVVATGLDRIIYITSTGELYRDEGGDAVYRAVDSSIDFKNGSDDKRMAKIYSSAYNPGESAENNGTPATFTTADFEIVNF